MLRRRLRTTLLLLDYDTENELSLWWRDQHLRGGQVWQPSHYPPLTRVSSAPGSDGSPRERSRAKLLLAHSSQVAVRRHSGLF